MSESIYQEIKFTDEDVVNIDEWIPEGEYNPHKKAPWLIHDAGFTVCVVFADNEQDALDEAVDNNKLDRWLIKVGDADDEWQDYMTKDIKEADSSAEEDVPEYVDAEGTKWWWRKYYEPTCLGNAGEPFDISTLGIIKLPNPKKSFCDCFNSMKGK